MHRRIAAATALLVCAAAGAPRALAQEVLRARGLPETTAVDTFVSAFGTVAAGVTPRGEVALALGPDDASGLHWRRGPRYGAREWVHPDSVRAWVERVRPQKDPAPFGTPALRFELPSQRPEKQRIGYFGIGLCGHGGGSVNHQSFARYLRLLEVLRHAADAAARPNPPAGAAEADGAPWWEHAVACPAAPRGPAPFTDDPAAPPLVVRFVVGADGRPEPGTLAALPGTAPERVEALRRALPAWSFSPALRGGRPVRQVVFLQVSPLAWVREDPPGPRRLYAASASADGLVEVRWGMRSEYAGPRPVFFTPDEVQAWVDAVRARRFPAWLGGPPAGRAAPARRTAVSADTANLAGRLHLRVHLGECGGAISGVSDSALVPRLERAAAAARARTLRFDPRAVYGPDQVDCTAVPDSANPAPRAALAGTAELHAAFVVDAEGRVEEGSLRAMPGSDPALVRALEAVLPRWRFLPATRLGRPVRQLVIAPVFFGRDGTGTIDPRDPLPAHFTAPPDARAAGLPRSGGRRERARGRAALAHAEQQREQRTCAAAFSSDGSAVLKPAAAWQAPAGWSCRCADQGTGRSSRCLRRPRQLTERRRNAAGS